MTTGKRGEITTRSAALNHFDRDSLADSSRERGRHGSRSCPESDTIRERIAQPSDARCLRGGSLAADTRFTPVS